MLEFVAYVESTRFAKNDVPSLDVHVPGSNNGFEADDPEAAKEFFACDKANIAGINAGVRQGQARRREGNGRFHAG